MKENKAKKELSKRARVINKILTGVQILLILVCVVFSIFVITNPGGYKKDPKDCNTNMMVVMTDSMEPTIKTNAMIFGKKTPKGILKLGTVATFATKPYGIDGYILDTHRIVAYQVSAKLDDKVVLEKVYYVRGVMEDYDDLVSYMASKGLTRGDEATEETFKLDGYITRGDKYSMQLCDRDIKKKSIKDVKDFSVYKLEANEDGTYDKLMLSNGVNRFDKEGNLVELNTNNDDKLLALDGVLAVWKGGKINGVGGIIRFLQKPVAFALIIILPLFILFAYNIFIIVKMIISDKSEKARKQALEEAKANQIDEEEIKRKAIEEYLASIAKKEE